MISRTQKLFLAPEVEAHFLPDQKSLPVVVDSGGPYRLIAATRSHYGATCADTTQPHHLRSVLFWALKDEFVPEGSYRRLARLHEQKVKREAEAEQRRLEKARAEARMREEANKAGWRRKFNAVVSALRPRLDLAIRRALDGANDAGQQLLMESIGFAGPNPTVSYYEALKRLQRGATDENVFTVLNYVDRTFAEEGRCLVLVQALNLPIAGCELLFKVSSAAPPDPY